MVRNVSTTQLMRYLLPRTYEVQEQWRIQVAAAAIAAAAAKAETADTAAVAATHDG